MQRETNCDAVMIGRTASQNPWIFRQIDEYLRTGRYTIPPDRDRYEIMKTYYQMLQVEGRIRRRRKDEAVRHLLYPRRP